LCKLERQPRDRFENDDIVKLRTRDLLGSPVFLSDPLKVTKVTGADVELELMPGSDPPAQALQHAPPGMPPGKPLGILLAQHHSPLGVPNTIIHQGVGVRIRDTLNPTNALSGDTPGRACTTGSVKFPTPATNFLPGTTPNPPMFSSWIAGLYESGATYDCGVYHPTGVCVMRAPTFAEGTKAYQFCHVCRYAMVDLIDPTQHGAIDDDYEPRFPTK
jgi:hypothetical protein